jgi:3'-phosphoadenosine 5'-phosphosulfate sulfotransferase (PAPS reductase)/FAD synthetase
MTASLSKLVDETVTNIRTVLHRFGSPAIMCSFGKDSIVMLHVLRESGFQLPVIYLRDPWQPHKHMHAEKVAREMGLTVHNWPPTAMGVKFNGELLEFVARYNFSEDSFIDVPKNIETQRPRQQLLCGLFDIIRRPTSFAKHNWDLLLLGHKNCDVDQYYGNVPLHVDIKLRNPGEPALYFPLREWSDEDIWDLIEQCKLPYQKDRYENRQELEDKSFSNDYVQCCSKCLNPDNGTVMCPKFGREINNMYEHVAHFDPSPEYFGPKEEAK